MSSPSFAASLFTGRLCTDMVTPFPMPEPAEVEKVKALVAALRDVTADHDPRRAEADRWIGDDLIARLGEAGLMGLYVDPAYGGAGLGQTGYCRVFEEIGLVDPTLSVVMGVHQSIGMKGIHLYGSDEQKERFLPDLASGRALCGFALTEPGAGSDAYHLDSWAERRSDGSWVLNGEKRYIGNGSKDVLTTFARCEQGHVALILEAGMEGFEVGDRHDTMGLRANDLRQLRFRDVVVPPENVLGEPGAGFDIAVNVLNNGRLSLGTGSVGSVKHLLALAVEHVTERSQFGQPLADFEMVQEKLGWMVSYLYGLESLCYLTTGMVDAGVEDYAIESAMAKVAGTEFLWYAANRVFQLAGGRAYMRDEPFEKVLRDIRIFPIFEGANDVMRAFIALTGLKPLAASLEGMADLDLGHPLRSLGTVAGYVLDKVDRGVRPDRLDVHDSLADLADPVSDQVGMLRDAAEGELRTHGEGIKLAQRSQKRLAEAAMDIYAQVATLSRMSAVVEERGPELAASDRYVAETFCTRAAHRVERDLAQLGHPDDERQHAIARDALAAGGYRYEILPL
ncbi:MAG TPA: acyl-CoA dehydrogenase family protein [Iamia sp.]|nr:acyl-CoA dehydrogenase family protein [Iamia sp.]